ncbi:hypothetical protein [Rhodococcus sp. IEGM 1330]|uniref:Rv2732c family membrane protein n=1 Tax=Rhodococcus sp. IEGM 1330 TaxID=3082225 RepID=UPI0029543187|nr:hypothetical protein [Rhodococcus sp. IEGM 1330]MDV8020918.1 hypothetical protein [Rhodococcus sp. IEGM 1330]
MTDTDGPDRVVPSRSAEELGRTERAVMTELDPGARALVVAGLVLVLLVTFALPHTGSASGFDVLTGSDAAVAESIALPSRVFVVLVLTFGVVMSVLALVTRVWALAWAALAGCAVSSVYGMFSIWTRQTVPDNLQGGGPGIGLIIAWIAVIALTFHWLKAVWNKTNAQLAAQEQRRIAAASGEQKLRLWDGHSAP